MNTGSRPPPNSHCFAFEVGLFGWMPLSYFVFFHPHLKPTNPIYWFMMQLGMIIGFFTGSG
jgi:hypothetical protein